MAVRAQKIAGGGGGYSCLQEAINRNGHTIAEIHEEVVSVGR